MPVNLTRPEPTSPLAAMLHEGAAVLRDAPMNQQTVDVLVACDVEQVIVPQLTMPPYVRTEDPAELIARHGRCEDAESPRRSELALVQVGYVDDLVNALRKFVERDAKLRALADEAYRLDTPDACIAVLRAVASEPL